MKNHIISDWARNITPSLTLAIDSKAKALKASGEDVCNFSSGEPDFDTPDFIKEACIRAIREGKTKYIDSSGLLELRKAVAEKASCENKILSLTEKNVVISAGAKYSCYLAILATCQPGCEVLIPSPFWLSYPEMVKLSGATPKFIETSIESGFKITASQLKKAITPQTRMLILNNPSNPTGIVYTRRELEDLVEVAIASNILILSDEIYENLVYDDAQHVSPASFSEEARNQIITISGFSKTFAMTGWRLGTLIANETLAKAVGNIQSHTTSNATTFVQYGALSCYTQKDEATSFLKKMRQIFDERRQLLMNGLQNLPYFECIPTKGAFYLFPKITASGMTSSAFANKLLDEAKIAVVPGLAFGNDQHIRFSYATSQETIEKALKRMRICLQ
ncbi:MAG: aspartate aminotransferase [Verrucomicrobia bacterium GWC2_42_7]|nr:MAG: aspartate aminotransferase [Verrucomicrobia bacterium GWC2_42_7]